jgi:hypothetical protein
MSKSKQQLVDEKLTIERALRHMLPEHVMLFVHPEKCALALFWGPDSPENVIEFFTRSEWDILLALAQAYPHYAPYEWLLQQLSSYLVDQAHELLHAAVSSTDRNRLLKPIHRALSSLRKKLQQLHPHLNISHVYETGYAPTSPTQGRSMSTSLTSQGGSDVQ